MIFYRFEDSDEVREGEFNLGYEKVETSFSKFIFGNKEPTCSFIFKSVEKSNGNDVYVFERAFGSRHTYVHEDSTKKPHVKKRRRRWKSPPKRWRSRSPVSNYN